jgi:hypothetical protein
MRWLTSSLFDIFLARPGVPSTGLLTAFTFIRGRDGLGRGAVSNAVTRLADLVFLAKRALSFRVTFATHDDCSPRGLVIREVMHEISTGFGDRYPQAGVDEPGG